MECSVEKKRFWTVASVFLMLSLGMVMAVSFWEYQTYSQRYNEKINEICLEIQEWYPEVPEYEIMRILDSDGAADHNFFLKYGIDLNRDSVILQNERDFRKHLAVNVSLFLLGAMVLLSAILLKNRKRQKQLIQISRYLKNINQGDYSFHMEGSSEGELSILESEIYKTTIMLKEAADQSRMDKERLKDSLSDISHQLKTPITSLMINLENLEDHPEIEPEARNRLIGNAKRDTNRISRMVQQLLTLSKLDANVIVFRKEKVSLSKIAEEAMENVAALSELRDISVLEEAGEESNTYITCDSYWEKQAITNILKNAIEHAVSQVIVRYRNYELYKEIVIENDGAPISEADRKNLFTRFYSGENSAKDSIGIGLSIANAIVKNDGGYIVVESDETTRFIIRYL